MNFKPQFLGNSNNNKHFQALKNILCLSIYIIQLYTPITPHDLMKLYVLSQ